MTQKTDLELVDSILEVCIGANRQVVEELLEDDTMYEVLMEIMEPKIKLREDKLRREVQEEVRKEVRKESIKGTISILRDLNLENSKIKSEIIKTYKLSESEAEEYL